ncbi:MAG: hypothetical protein ABW161_14305 [Candidatus Thiodiazotropha sp.]
MSKDFVMQKTEGQSRLVRPKSSWARRWFQGMVGQSVRPPSPGKPLGVHLPERVWQRQFALLMSLHDRYDEAP